MRDLTPNEIYILYRHPEWVESNGAQGKRADLRDADLFCEYRNDVPKLVEE